MSKPTLDSARQYYQGRKAETYEDSRASKAKWRAEHKHLGFILKSVRGSVIDVPVGTGRFLQLYKDRGLKAVGVDYSKEMLEQARAKHPDAVLQQGDITNLEFDTGAFDAAVCVRLLHLIAPDEVLPVMTELMRVAKHHLIVTVHLNTGAYVQGRSQVHTRNGVMSCVQSPWALSSSTMLLAEKGTPYHMLHFVR